MIGTKQILEELKTIKVDLDYIKGHLMDPDIVMTEEDYEALLVYRNEKKTGKLVSHNTLKKELEL